MTPLRTTAASCLAVLALLGVAETSHAGQLPAPTTRAELHLDVQLPGVDTLLPSLDLPPVMEQGPGVEVDLEIDPDVSASPTAPTPTPEPPAVMPPAPQTTPTPQPTAQPAAAPDAASEPERVRSALAAPSSAGAAATPSPTSTPVQIAAPGATPTAAVKALPARVDPLMPAVGTCKNATNGTRSLREQQQAMLCLMRQVRRAARVPVLKESTKLRRAAGNKSTRVVRCKQFAHDPCGKDWKLELRQVGYLNGRWVVGENLAWGSRFSGTPYLTLNAWLQSPGHRKNLLSRTYKEVGLSVRWRSTFNGTDHVAVWAAEFGQRT